LFIVGKPESEMVKHAEQIGSRAVASHVMGGSAAAKPCGGTRAVQCRMRRSSWKEIVMEIHAIGIDLEKPYFTWWA
jgi:hypothetical protein